MKKRIQRKDLDLKVIFEGLVGDAFASDLQREIEKIGSLIKEEEEGKITAFGFYREELK